VRAYLAIPRVSADDNIKHTKSNIRYDNKINKNETNVKYIRIHVYEYTERMFASNLSHRDRKPKYLSNSEQNMVLMASDGPSPYSPSLRLGLPASPAIETPPRPVPAGPLIS